MSQAGGKGEYHNGQCDGCADIRALQGEVKALARAVERRNKQIAELKVKVDERDTLEAHLRLAVAEREKLKTAFSYLQAVRDQEIIKRGEMRQELMRAKIERDSAKEALSVIDRTALDLAQEDRAQIVRLRSIAAVASLPVFRGLACTCHQEEESQPCAVCQLRNELDGYTP